MSNFDIGTLLNFRLPKYFCEKCKALLYSVPHDWKKETAWCPVCGVKYKSTRDYSFFSADEYLKDKGNALSFENPVEHGQRLAVIAHRFNGGDEFYPPMRALFEALNSAAKFIHFTTFGLSHVLFGSLKLKAQRIPVRGIAANIHPDFASEIRDHPSEARYLSIQIFERDKSAQDFSRIPHQKLIVIDGLMAFKGAANMTVDGWRKAATGRDHVEVVTNIKEVVELHNKLFSPIWAEFSDVAVIDMEQEIPF